MTLHGDLLSRSRGLREAGTLAACSEARRVALAAQAAADTLGDRNVAMAVSLMAARDGARLVLAEVERLQADGVSSRQALADASDGVDLPFSERFVWATSRLGCDDELVAAAGRATAAGRVFTVRQAVASPWRSTRRRRVSPIPSDPMGALRWSRSQVAPKVARVLAGVADRVAPVDLSDAPTGDPAALLRWLAHTFPALASEIRGALAVLESPPDVAPLAAAVAAGVALSRSDVDVARRRAQREGCTTAQAWREMMDDLRRQDAAMLAAETRARARFGEPAP